MLIKLLSCKHVKLQTTEKYSQALKTIVLLLAQMDFKITGAWSLLFFFFFFFLGFLVDAIKQKLSLEY